MKLSRHNMICSEEFSDLDLRETELFDIDFSKDGLYPSTFTNCSIGRDSLILLGHTCIPEYVAISDNGRFLATGSCNEQNGGVVYVWDLITKKKYRDIHIEKRCFDDSIIYLSFSCDCKTIIIGVESDPIKGDIIVYQFDIDSSSIIWKIELIRQIQDYNESDNIMSYIDLISSLSYNLLMLDNSNKKLIIKDSCALPDEVVLELSRNVQSENTQNLK